MNARQLRQLLPVLHAFAYRGIVEYKPMYGDIWTRINPDTTEFRPEQMNPLEWRWTPTMPDDDEIMADYTEAEFKSRIEELTKERNSYEETANGLATRVMKAESSVEELERRLQIMREWMEVQCCRGVPLSRSFYRYNPEAENWFDENGKVK